MKTSLWVVIVVVAGLVGFLLGYSVSSSTGTRSTHAEEQKAAAGGRAAAPAPGAASPQTPVAPKADGGGYGAAAPQADAGGSGAGKPAPAGEPARKKPAPAKRPAAAGGY